MEIERKFLISNIDNLDLTKYKSKEIIQDYLYVDNFTAIRKRNVTEEKDNIFTYTVKTNKVGIKVNEIETKITKEQYENLKINEDFNQIDKTRYIIPYKDNLKIELDVFHGIYDGLIFAEIEFESEEQAKNIKLPDWFGKELSYNITNSEMAIKSVREIIKKIENIGNNS